jgi:hypothetical protein
MTAVTVLERTVLPELREIRQLTAPAFRIKYRFQRQGPRQRSVTVVRQISGIGNQLSGINRRLKAKG